MGNPEKMYARIAAVVAVLAGGLIFLPGWLGIDGMDGGYALSSISVWIAISAGLVAGYFWQRAGLLECLLDGQVLLAHWTYSPVEWQAYASAEQEEQLRDNRGLWLFMAGLSLALGMFFWLFDQEAGQFVLLVMASLGLLLAIFALGLPRLRRLRRRKRQGEVWLAPTAFYFDGVFIPWDSWEAHLHKVDLHEASLNKPACLAFHITHIISTGIQNQVLRVPVPSERIDEARLLLRHFKTTSHQPARRRTA